MMHTNIKFANLSFISKISKICDWTKEKIKKENILDLFSTVSNYNHLNLDQDCTRVIYLNTVKSS